VARAVSTHATSPVGEWQTMRSLMIALVMPARGHTTLAAVSATANTIGRPTRGWSVRGPSVIRPDRVYKGCGQVIVSRGFHLGVFCPVPLCRSSRYTCRHYDFLRQLLRFVCTLLPRIYRGSCSVLAVSNRAYCIYSIIHNFPAGMAGL